MKKNFLLMPFVLGIAAMMLAVVTVVVFAVPCNEEKRSDKKTVAAACSAALSGASCSSYSNQADCQDEQMVVVDFNPIYGNNNSLFTGTTDGGASDHAVELTFVCGIVHNCEFSTEQDKCITGTEAISPTTGESIKRTRTHYDNDDCEAGG